MGANRECTWSARAEVAWITLTAGAEGQGEGSISFSVASNPLVTARRGTIIVNDQRVEVTQAAGSCAFALSSTSGTFEANGGASQVTVSAQSGCTWSAASEVSWITVAAGAGGTGDGTVTLQVAANPSQTPRTGTVVIAGVTYTATQAAAPSGPPAGGCSVTAAPESLQLPADPTVRLIVLTASVPSCPWTVTSSAPWLSVRPVQSGNGGRQLEVVAEGNPSASPRTAVLTIGTQTVPVTQAGAAGSPTPGPCTFNITPPSASAPSTATTVDARLDASSSACSWTASPQATWITMASGTSGTGSADLRVNVAANTSTSSRTGVVAIAGQTLTITQSGAAPAPVCVYTVAPSSQSVAVGGGSHTVTVTTSAPSCGWTSSVTDGSPWITITAGANGTGSGEVRYTVAANTTSGERSGALTIAGQRVAVTQAAPAPCNLTVTPTSQSANAPGGAFTATVAASANSCGWTSSSNSSWITIASGANGMGGGEVKYNVAPNVSTSERTGTLTVAGRTVTVTQAGVPVPPVTVAGEVSGLSGSCPSLSFRLGARNVRTNGATIFSGGSCASLRDGRKVTVVGTPQADGALLALTLTREND